jgi:hypothetical protein
MDYADRQSPGLLGWLRKYDRAALSPDVIAGLTAAAVVLRKAMAYGRDRRRDRHLKPRR